MHPLDGKVDYHTYCVQHVQRQYRGCAVRVVRATCVDSHMSPEFNRKLWMTCNDENIRSYMPETSRGVSIPVAVLHRGTGCSGSRAARRYRLWTGDNAH